ncbi:MAG: calcium/sodium antiporter [Clostridiales bacterium]|nr:calcium/sodium antiporter [Clostridiales bacterium]
MALNILILIVGFAVLVKGADIFVDGSASLARLFKISGLIIGLTIVALGTSAPELAVSTTAALSGSNEIALSNVIGSNLFNLLVVLGICAVISPVPTGKDIIKRDYPISLIATVLVFILASGIKLFSCDNPIKVDVNAEAGKFTRIGGIILLVCFVSYIVLLIIEARKHPSEGEKIEERSLGKCILFIIIGLAMVIGGGQAVVYSSKAIARDAGMSETLIGLTVVAFGTSLPELVTSIVAARKNETELAVGNVIGSNIFNLLFILGVSTTIHPIGVNYASLQDMVVLFFVSILTFLFLLRKKKLTRVEGVIMILLYSAQVAFAILR